MEYSNEVDEKIKINNGKTPYYQELIFESSDPFSYSTPSLIPKLLLSPTIVSHRTSIFLIHLLSLSVIRKNATLAENISELYFFISSFRAEPYFNDNSIDFIASE